MRPALVLLCAEAAGGGTQDAVPPGVAVELVHNFSLLHDDIMDRDVERRHRPTAWTIFGEGQALLAGTAMLTAAVDVLLAAGPAGQRSLPCLLDAVQRLISGQSEDLALEGRTDADLDAVLHMEAGKTAALLSCSAALGALAVGAPPEVVEGLAAYGHELGMAFQLDRRHPRHHRRLGGDGQVGLVRRARGQAQRADRGRSRRRHRRLAPAGSGISAPGRRRPRRTSPRRRS